MSRCTGYPAFAGYDAYDGAARCVPPLRNAMSFVAPMVIVLRNGKVNRIRPLASNPCETSAFAIHGGLRRQRIYVPFIAMIKLPFKFDRS
jgi:hypothetical protein